jgi:hypothetical protein
MSEIIDVLFVDDDYDDFIITEKNLKKVKRVEIRLERAKDYDEAVK